jgi:hypothetical protein
MDRDEGPYHDVLVYVRTQADPDVDEPWKCVVIKRSYVNPVASTHGQILRALLRSLA